MHFLDGYDCFVAMAMGYDRLSTWFSQDTGNDRLCGQIPDTLGSSSFAMIEAIDLLDDLDVDSSKDGARSKHMFHKIQSHL